MYSGCSDIYMLACRSRIRSGVYNDAGGPGRLLRPQHVGSIDIAGSEPHKKQQQQQQSKYPAPREGTKDLSAKETDELLRSLFARCHHPPLQNVYILHILKPGPSWQETNVSDSPNE